MQILSAINSLNPADGGPVECVMQLQRNMMNLGHSLQVITCDGPDAPWNKNLPFGPIFIGRGDKPEKNPLRIASALSRVLNDFDASLLHGIWTRQNIGFLRAWKGQTPYAVFPHGMLDPYFIKYFPFKHLKKAAYYKTICVPLLRDAHAVLFTCEEERRLANTSYKPIVGRRVVVRYGIDDPTFRLNNYRGRLTEWADTTSRGKDVVLYLGRIHPKKGCDLLIKAFAKAAEQDQSLHLAMVGPDAGGWTSQLKALAESLGVAHSISSLAPAYQYEKWFLYNIASVFILPSHMENFGMAVAESLSQCCPVLISDKVNIHASITRHNAGYVEVDTFDGTLALLRHWSTTPAEKRLVMKKNARQLFLNEFQAIQTAQDLLDVFQTDFRQLDRFSVQPRQNGSQIEPTGEIL